MTRARKRFRAGEPEGLHDLRVSLRRVAAVARALGDVKLERRAKKVVRSLSDGRQLEIDRSLLERLNALGQISPESAAAIDARWASTATSASAISRAAGGRRLRRVVRRLARLDRATASKPALDRLLAARAAAEVRLGRPFDLHDDDALHRHRLAVKRARYLAEELVALGRSEFAPAVEREKAVQEALGRWNDLRLFLSRLERERRRAERRGRVGLAGELHRLARALIEPLASIRRAAVAQAARASRVLSFDARSA